MQVLPAPVGTRPLPAPQQFGERIIPLHEIGESGRIRIGVPLVRRSEIAVEMLLWPLRARRIDFAIIKPLALVRIAEQIIRTGDFFELLFRGLFTRVEVGMQLFRKLPIRALDLGSG